MTQIIQCLIGLGAMMIVMPLMADDLPVLTLYIFDHQAEDKMHTTENKRASSTNEQPELQMFIFDDDAQTEPEIIFSADEFALNYQLDAGYRTEKLSWNVASPAGSPDPLTEVKWNNISLWRLQGQFAMSLPVGIQVKGQGAYGWTLSGSGQETSYGKDHRQQPFLQRDSEAGSGYGWELSLALGYPFTLQFNSQQDSITLTPLAGYQWQQQRWDLNTQEVLPASRINNQTSTYTTDWRGPWLGMDLTLDLFKQHQWFSSFEHHWARYRAYADWQQASQLQNPQSFQHDTDSTGMVISTGYRYRFPQSLGLSVSVDYARWQGESGQEQLTLSNGQLVHSQLNGIDREVLGVNLGVNWSF